MIFAKEVAAFATRGIDFDGKPDTVALSMSPEATYVTDRVIPPQAWWRRKRTLVGTASALMLTLSFAVANQFLLGQSTRLSTNGDYSIGEVRRGFLAITVQGSGTLRPVDERWLTAKTNGVVAEVPAQSGTLVEAGEVVVRLANAEMEQLVRQADFSVAEARASHSILLARIEDRALDREATLASVAAALEEAELRQRAEAELLEKGAISQIAYEGTRIRADQARLALDIERRRAARAAKTTAAELQASEARSANRELAREQALARVASLDVRTQTTGIVQEVFATLGESVINGTKVARIADPSRLRAIVRVPESYASKLAAGQVAEVNVLSHGVPAVVSRVDPSVTGGSVVVDLEFTGSLPEGVRPDLSIRATVFVAEMEDALFVQRPPGAFDNRTADVFVLDAKQDTAARRTVQFGAGTLSHVHVLEGLEEGERIVLANVRRFERADVVSVE